MGFSGVEHALPVNCLRIAFGKQRPIRQDDKYTYYPMDPQLSIPTHRTPLARSLFSMAWLNLAWIPMMLLTVTVAEAATDRPLTYDKEHTGTHHASPALPVLEALPIIHPLTDPLAWSDGSGRVKGFEDWQRRRSEIKAEIEHYEIGLKPPRPKNLNATYEKGVLTVVVQEGGQTLTLSSNITLPEGEGPFPAIIGIGRGTGSLPSELFANRGIAQIPYAFRQVMSHTQKRGEEPINRLYPEAVNMGAYSAWSWGVSRLIDGLELVQDKLPVDLSHLAISGCSFAGKMALFAGAFDERIALTIAQEPGGGGAASWRVSETLGNVEKLGATSHAWFMESMFQFAGSQVWKLPMDHHELMAMVAPRALLVLGNPDYQWLAEESGYVSCRAAHEVWKAFGIGDRFGFSIVAGHPHCRLPKEQYPEVEAFVDKFLLGRQETNTQVAIHPFEGVDHAQWYDWWGQATPSFKGAENATWVAAEAECAQVGEGWEIITEDGVSEGRFVAPKAGVQSLDQAPTSKDHQIHIPVTLEKGGAYTLFARLRCPSADDDSCWLQIDDAEPIMRNGLGTSGWQWITMEKLELEAGTHQISIGVREDGLGLDKICLSTFFLAPEELGPQASNRCLP